MILKKQGFPEDEEIVLCTVTAVQANSVFVKVDEYDKSGMIHISEIAPGRIRNIREYVEEGKKIVCKVLRTDKEKGYIDLSLRRVNESQRRSKLNDIKQELLAEKIVEHLAKQRKEDIVGIYNKIRGAFSEWAGLFPAFEAISKNELEMPASLDKSMAEQLKKGIMERITPPEVVIEGELSLSSYASNGVALIKDTLSKAETKKGNSKSLEITYKGAGVYRFVVKAEQFKEAEKTLKEASEAALEAAKQKKIAAEFKRLETK